MTPPPAPPAWRDLEVGLVLPDRAFGAAVEIEGLLDEPDLHYSATLGSSRLLLMPRAGAFTRLALEWQTLPEVGVFTARSFPPDDYDASQLARLETWMRDVASTCQALRSRIRESAERVVRDATEGRERSLPGEVPDWAHVVTTHVGSRVAPPPSASARANAVGIPPIGVVDVDGPAGSPIMSSTSTPDATGPDEGPGREGLGGQWLGREASDREWHFRERTNGRLLGRRRVERAGDDDALHYEVLDPRVATSDLERWFEQHIVREVLFDDVWQVYVHLLAGLDAPLNVAYFG